MDPLCLGYLCGANSSSLKISFCGAQIFVTWTPEMGTTELFEKILVNRNCWFKSSWSTGLPHLFCTFHSMENLLFLIKNPLFLIENLLFLVENLLFLIGNLLFLLCWTGWEPCSPLEGSLTLSVLPCWIFFRLGFASLNSPESLQVPGAALSPS